MKKNRLLLTAAAACLLPLFSFGQDIHFSQLTETPLLFNPAMAGLGHDVNAIINYRDQWKSVSSSPYKTFDVSADMAFLKKQNGNHMGLGLDFFSDKAGDGQMGTTTGKLHVSGILGVNDNNQISAGLFGGFGQRSLSYDKFYWDNQYVNGDFDLSLPSMEPNSFSNHTYADMGAGLAWFYGKGHSTISSNDAMNFTLGASVQHLNKPVYSFYGNSDMRLPMKLVVHGNADIGWKNHSIILEPGYLVMIQGGHHEINAGLLVKYLTQENSHYTGRKKPAAFVLGGYYRFGDAANLVAAYEMSSFRAGFSYDINMSNLTTASKARGGFEISLRYTLIDTGENKNKKFFN